MFISSRLLYNSSVLRSDSDYIVLRIQDLELKNKYWKTRNKSPRFTTHLLWDLYYPQDRNLWGRIITGLYSLGCWGLPDIIHVKSFVECLAYNTRSIKNSYYHCYCIASSGAVLTYCYYQGWSSWVWGTVNPHGLILPLYKVQSKCRHFLVYFYEQTKNCYFCFLWSLICESTLINSRIVSTILVTASSAQLVN